MRDATARWRWLAFTSLAALAAGLAPSIAKAGAQLDTQAIDVTTVGTYPPLTNNGFNYYQEPGNYTFTWNFTANAPIQVTQLGYYNSGLAGTAEPNGFGSHLVTLSDLTTEETLASTTVTARDAATGVFNYGTVTPVALNTTDTYQVSGTMTDQYYLVGLNQAAAPTAPEINYQFTETDIFGTPGPDGTYQDFGPNFEFVSASTCTENVIGRNVIALSGDSCTAAPGTYNPTTTQVTLPVTYNGFGLYANGGAIDSPGAIVINTTDPKGTGGSYGAWADGAGSVLTFEGTSSVNTAGADSHGVYASGGGRITSTGALSVATTGTGAFGIYGSGAGTTITAALGAISTIGDFAAGAKADAGAMLTLTGGTVTTSGAQAPGLYAAGAGSVIIGTDIAVSTSGAGASGVLADTGGVVNITGGSVKTSGIGSLGLYATGLGSTVAANNVAISTTGAGGAFAALASNGGNVVLKGGSASTSGVDVYALGVAGGTMKATGTAVTTTGAGGGGVAVSGSASSFTGINLTILANGAYDTANGVASLGVANQTSGANVGGGTVNLTNSSITMGGAFAIGLYNANGGSATMSGGAVDTSGLRSNAVVGVSGSSTSLTGVQIATTGDGSHGLAFEGAGTKLSGSNLTISTSGNVYASSNYAEALYNGNGSGSGGGSTGGATVSLTASSFVTTGVHAFGVATENGGATTLTNSSVKTSGVQADAIFGSSGAAITLVNVTLTASGNAAKGIDIEGTGATLSGSGLTISTSGSIDTATGFHAQGVYNGSSSPAAAGETGGGRVSLADTIVTTSGTNAYGVDTANNGFTEFSGGSIATTGAGSIAVLATDGATTQIDADINGNATTISTSAASTSAVAATTGATITLTSGNISTSGDGAWGLSVRDQGARVNATDVTIHTAGSLIGGTGLYAFGVYNGPGSGGTSGGTLTLNDANVSTAGVESHALLTDAGGVTSVSGGVYATSGEHAEAIIALNGGVISVSGATLTTSGAGAAGLFLGGAGGRITADTLTITTTGGPRSDGTGAFGVYAGPYNGASGGGTVSLADSAVKTSGQAAIGVLSDPGGAITVTGGSVATSGDGAHAVYADNGGALAVGLDAKGLGASLTTSGVSAFGADAYNGGAVTLTGAKISTAGDGSMGLVVNGASSTLTATDVTIATKGGLDAGGGNLAYGLYNGPGALASGGKASLTNVNVTTSGDGAAGVATGNGGITTVVGGSFATAGQNAAAALTLTGGQTSISGAALTTTGDGASGLVANGGGGVVTASNLTVSTSGAALAANGPHADGVYAFDGKISLADSSVKTIGAQSYGVAADGGGTISVLGGAISTAGAGATAARADLAGELSIDLNAKGQGASLSTSGAGAYGALADNAGFVLITGATIATTGDGAAGLGVAGGAAELHAANVTITTTGGADAASGLKAYGAVNAPGAYANGGTLTLNDVAIETSGAGMHGLYTSGGGVSTMSGGSIATSGAGANALRADPGGSIAVTLDANGKGASLSTSGAGAFAAMADGGALVTLLGAGITTTGDGSGGLSVSGQGSELDATNVTIATAGGAASGLSAYGAVANGGTLKLNDVAITTSGASIFGLYASGGVTTVAGGSIATSGAGADAVRADPGGAISIGLDAGGKGATLSTTGEGAYAALAQGGGALTLTGATLATTGDGSGGLGVNGQGSEIDARNVTISTRGGADAASGLSAYGAVASGGTLKLTDVAITTSGAGMYGVYARASSTTTYAGGSVTTSGANAYGLYASGVETILTASGVSVKTSGVGAYGAAADGGAALTLGGGAEIATTGAGAHGLYATGAGTTLTASALSVATAGAGAYGAAALGGAALTLGDGAAIATSGAAAHGLYVSGAAADIAGATSIAVTGANAAGVFVDTGGSVAGKGALTVSAATYGLSVNGAATLALGGPLSLKTTDPTGAALTLTGNSASFAGAGGGVIEAAGTAIALKNGSNQSATFLNYQIDSAAGDLIFTDPATSTVEFDNSTVNAAGNLAHVTDDSDLTMSAIASQLTGAVVTDPGSVSTMTLSNGSTWTLTGNSSVTNLAVNNSAVVFAPTTGGFQTLTVNNYAGNNAAMTFNAALGGVNPAADQLVIDGGRASGTTTVNVRPVGVGAAAGAAPGAAGVPLVITTNGGSIASGAFTLSGPINVGGYSYTLQDQAGGEYLVANQAQTLTSAQASGSLASLAQSRQSAAITSRVLGSILTGATEQINCSSCSSGFASFGSFALGVHGRWTLSPSLALLAGISYDSYSARGVTVNNAMLGAIGLRYDMVNLGKNRPFFETGVSVEPYANVSYRRSYASAAGGGLGTGDTLSRSLAVYGRAGYIWRLDRTDEAAVYGDLTRSWQSEGGYVEGGATAGNPFGASIAPALDTLNIAHVGGQFTHLFGEHIEANISAGYAYAFGANYGTSADIAGFGAAAGAAASSFSWAELGGRVSYRFSKHLTADAFVLGTLGAEPAGNQIHGGLALRMAF